MPHISGATAPVFELPGLTVTGLAAPSRGSRETSMSRLTLAPGTPGVTHSVNREEVFVATGGRAEATLDGKPVDMVAGDALIVPADTLFALANPGDEEFTAVVALPVGGRATVGDDDPFTPPWAS